MGDSNSKLDKFFSFLSSVLLKIELTIAITAFTLMLVDVLAGIVMRKFLEIAFPWGEEASRRVRRPGDLPCGPASPPPLPGRGSSRSGP